MANSKELLLAGYEDFIESIPEDALGKVCGVKTNRDGIGFIYDALLAEYRKRKAQAEEKAKNAPKPRI